MLLCGGSRSPRDPKLILAFQPARGLDLAATRDVYEAIGQECKDGAAALIVGYGLDELLSTVTGSR